MKVTGSLTLVCLITALMLFVSCSPDQQVPKLDHRQLAGNYFGADSSWFIKNIPFFECSDKDIEQVYYYRWKMYKAHIRRVSDSGYVITEFITHMDWDREPYCTIDAATMHHIYEGRWIKDPRYMDGYINNMFQDGGDNRHYSEGIADAAYNRFLVNADSAFLLHQLDSMKSLYNQWYDHWDSSKQLFYIPAMPDATEYTIASIDASGGKDGFAGGDAFRPTLNSYMYGNAIAIAHVAAMKGDAATEKEYLDRAASLKERVTRDLWNKGFEHFVDRFKQDNQYVHYWDYIRGRELAGLIPWYYNLPPDSAEYSAAWKHAIDTNALLGQYGFRTNEPSYQYYFRQYTFNPSGKPGSQWNGPSWPYQSSQVITAMANLLNNYHQSTVNNSDYLKVLRLFTRQHFLPDGKINLVEDYDPNKGGPIVYFYWSNHYNHSSYNNLIINGLCGIRPSAGDTLDINPLIDSSIHYFFLDDIAYHGHQLSVLYDADGSRYHTGKGLSVFIDGKKAVLTGSDNKYRVTVGAPVKVASEKYPPDLALNISRNGFPVPSASVNSVPDSLYQAIDGRTWYFPEVRNRWCTLGSTSTEDWYALDFGSAKELNTVSYALFADGNTFAVPDKVMVEYQQNGQWMPVQIKDQLPSSITANRTNSLHFEKINTSQIRIRFQHTHGAVAISEIECNSVNPGHKGQGTKDKAQGTRNTGR